MIEKHISGNSKLPIVLILVSCYLPGFKGGGPIRSIANIVEQLGHEFDFRIITSDRDLGDSTPYSGIVSDTWIQCGNASVYYISPDFKLSFRLVNVINSVDFDVLYLNSFFNFNFSIVPIFARYLGFVKAISVILAPRGEFSDDAFNIKRWKKSLYLILAKAINVFKGVVWHASTNYELDDILKKIDGLRIDAKVAYVACDIPNRISDDNFYKNKFTFDIECSQSVLNICFLSRISPMKNLDYAICVLKSVRVPVKFCIFGPKESNDYWSLCEDLLISLPNNISWFYGGEVKNSDVKDVISQFDLFFVPSRGENFGHVFHEALSAGVPLLISDRTPWRGLQDVGIGWDFSLNQPLKFSEAIEAYSQVSPSERISKSRACIEYSIVKALDKDVLDMNRALFNFN